MAEIFARELCGDRNIGPSRIIIESSRILPLRERSIGP